MPATGAQATAALQALATQQQALQQAYSTGKITFAQWQAGQTRINTAEGLWTRQLAGAQHAAIYNQANYAASNAAVAAAGAAQMARDQQLYSQGLGKANTHFNTTAVEAQTAATLAPTQQASMAALARQAQLSSSQAWLNQISANQLSAPASSHPATASEPSNTAVVARPTIPASSTLPNPTVIAQPVVSYPSGTVSSPGEVHSGVAPSSWSASSLTTTQWAIVLAVVGAAILMLILALG